MDDSAVGIVVLVVAGVIALGALTAAKWQVLRDQIAKLRRDETGEGPPDRT
jgi:hypothetical protein